MTELCQVLSAPSMSMNLLVRQKLPQQTWVMAKDFKQFRTAGFGV